MSRPRAFLCRGRATRGHSSQSLVVGMLAIVLLPAWAPAQSMGSVPWRPGNADHFQTGAAEERQARSEQGTLPVTIYRPVGEGPVPFVVLLHGCGVLQYESVWTRWVQPWVELFREHGLGTAVVDSDLNPSAAVPGDPRAAGVALLHPARPRRGLSKADHIGD